MIAMSCLHNRTTWSEDMPVGVMRCRDCDDLVPNKVRSPREVARNIRTVQFPSTEIAAQKGWNGGATRRTVEGSVDEAWAAGKRTQNQLEAAARREACGATSPQRFAYLTACGARRIVELKKKARAERKVTWTDKKK